MSPKLANDSSVRELNLFLNRAIQLAIAENTCEVVNGKNHKPTEKVLNSMK
jgi:hypothetical protein